MTYTDSPQRHQTAGYSWDCRPADRDCRWPSGRVAPGDDVVSDRNGHLVHVGCDGRHVVDHDGCCPECGAR